jgi:hypothetical protein
MYKNRIRGLRRRTSRQLTTKSVSIKDAGGKSGGRVSKAVELIAGDLWHVADSRLSVERSTLTLPQKFYKGRSQEKKHPLRLEFFLLRSPTDQARSVPISRAMCSVAGRVRPAIWSSSISGFHRLSATKPISSETSKAERRSSGGRVGGGALTRWPPSATQTVRADFRHTAFTKTPPKGEEQVRE